MSRIITLLAVWGILLLAGCGGSGGGDNNPIKPPNPPPDDKTAEWTVMLYMGGDNNLAPIALIDLNELEQVGSTDKVHFTALADVYYECYDQYGASIACILDDSGVPVVPMMHITKHPEDGVQSHLTDTGAVLYPSVGFNSADPNNLKNFIKWSADRFPAKRYALVIWDHGSSWLPGRAGSAAVSDSYEGDGNSMFIHEIEAAIKGAGTHLNLLSFIACNMGGVEVAYQLKDVTDFICGSQKTMIAGNDDNFKTIANFLTSNPAVGPEALGKAIIDAYINFWAQDNDSSLTASLVRTDRLPAVAQAVNQLTPLLADPAVISSDELRESFFEPVRFLQDVDLCNYTYVVPYHVQSPALNTALSTIREKVHNAVIYNRTFTTDQQDSSWTFGTREFGQGEDINVTGAEGLNIYLPTDTDWTQNNFGYYNSIAFNSATGWNYVIAHAYEGIPYLGTAPGNWYAMLVWSTGVDLDLWVFEPAGYDEFTPASPCMGSQSLNAYLSTDSHWTGIPVESYMTKPEVIWGPYFFLADYYMPNIFSNSAYCMLAIGYPEDDEPQITSEEYYISATQPNDPDFGQGVVYFGFALYNPDDGFWYFFEGDRGGEANLSGDKRAEMGTQLKSLEPGITKNEQPQTDWITAEDLSKFEKQGQALADELRTQLKQK